jgi:tripartite-type tricarboxylate transporter receptor subunit TctC
MSEDHVFCEMHLAARSVRGVDLLRQFLDRTNVAFVLTMNDPRLKQRIVELGDTVFVSSPAEFRKFVADFIEKWGKIIRAANIKAQ